MADFTFNYPDSAYGIPTGAMQSYWRKMRQNGATSGVYVPNSVRRAEMEGMMDSMAKNASLAAQRRLEQKRWEGEMSLKREMFENDKTQADRNRTTQMAGSIVSPFVNYYSQKNLLEQVYGKKKQQGAIPTEGGTLPPPNLNEASYGFPEGSDWFNNPLPTTTTAAASNAPPIASTPTSMMGGIKSGAENLWNKAGTAIDTYPKSILAGNAVGTAVGQSSWGEPIGKALLLGQGGQYDRRATAAGATGFLTGYLGSGGDTWAGVLSAIFPALSNSSFNGKRMFS